MTDTSSIDPCAGIEYQSHSDALSPKFETSSIHACTGIERLMTFLHDDFDGLGMGIIVARFDGIFDADRLRLALASVQQRNAKLRAALHTDATGLPCFHVMANAPPIPMEIRRDPDPDMWMTAVLEPPPVPFSPREVPLLRVLLIEHDERRQTDLVITVHHAIFDGASGLEFLRQIVHFYAYPDCPLSPVDGGFGIAPHGPRGYLGRLASILRLIGTVSKRKVIDSIYRPPLTPDEVPSPGAVQRWVLSAEETSALVARCRRERTTMLGALGAATLAALAGEYGWAGKKVACQVPFGIRAMLEPPVHPEVFGVFIAGVRFLASQTESTDFWEQARQFRGQFEQSLERHRRLELLRMLSWIKIRPKKMRGRIATVALNNFGKIARIEANGGPRLTEISTFGKQHVSGAPLLVQAITVSNRFNMTLRAERLSRETVRRLGSAMHDTLLQASAER